MSVNCPPWQWPESLSERGPAEDPALLLTGAVRLGNAAMQIVAIRINPALRWALDCRSDLAERAPGARAVVADLETILEELEYAVSEVADLLGESHSSVVELPTGHYRVWVVPASFDG